MANLSSGSGSPVGVVFGSPGDLYVDTAGGKLWCKQTGAATNTGWGVPVSDGVTLQGDGSAANPFAIKAVQHDGSLTGSGTVASPLGGGGGGGGSTGNLNFGRFGDGSDGALVYDGVATILGMAPVVVSGVPTYTLTRSIYPSAMTVNNTVRIKTNGYQIFVDGTLTGAGSAQIDDTGNTPTTSAGGTTRAAGWYPVTLAGGGGGIAGSNSIATLAAPWGLTSAGGTGSTVVSGLPGNPGTHLSGGGGGAAGDTGNGANGGSTTIMLQTRQGPIHSTLSQGAGQVSFNGVLSSGAGGGGGGGSGGSTGGGGGAGAGLCFVAAKAIAGVIAIQSLGGGGAPGQVGNGGGGGGGGGGYVWVEYITNSGTLNLSAAGGAGGAGLGSGQAGGTGGAGVTFKISGDGT